MLLKWLRKRRVRQAERELQRLDARIAMIQTKQREIERKHKAMEDRVVARRFKMFDDALKGKREGPRRGQL